MGLVFVSVLLKCAHGNVLQHGQLGKGLRNLKGTHHAPSGNLVHRQAHDVLTQQFNLTLVNFVEASDGRKQGRFARAVGANQGHNLTGAHLKRCVVDGAQTPKYFGQSIHFEHHASPVFFAADTKRPASLCSLRLNNSTKPLGKKAMMMTNKVP